MSLPPPSQNSKHETKKSWSSKILSSDHDQSEKEGENDQAKISPSLPQVPLKKRSALEDLTNSSHSQPAQLKKEANKEFVKDISKKINRDIPTLGMDKNNEMNMKKYKLEPSSVAVSTTMVPNTVEKPLLLETSTISHQTPPTEEASLYKKPLVLKEEPTNGDGALTKMSLSLKKHTNQGEASLLEKPLSLQKETDRDSEFVVEPMALVEKHETEKAAITKWTLPLKKTCTYQGEQSCQGEEVALQDIKAEEHSFMEPMNVMKKPKTEEAMLKKLLTLKKCATQGKTSHKNMSTCQERVDSQNTIGKENDSLFMEPVSFKKSSSEGAIPIKTLFSLKKKRKTQSTMTPLNKPLVLEKSTSEDDELFKKPLPYKKKPSTNKGFLFQDPSVLKAKHTTLQKLSLSKKPLALQRQTTTEKQCLTVEPFSLHVKPINTYGPTFQKGFNLQKKTDTKENLKKLLAPQKKGTTEEKSLSKKPFVQSKTFSTEITTSEKSQLSLKEKPTAQDETKENLKKLLAPQKKGTTEEKSLSKKPFVQSKTFSTETTTSVESQLSLKEKPTAQDEEKNITNEELLLKQPLALQKPGSENRALLKEPLAFQEQPTISEAFHFKGIPPLSGKPTMGQLSFGKPVTLQANPTHKEDTFLKDLLICQDKARPHVSSTATLSSLSSLSATSDSSACKSSSNKPFSSWDKISQNEITLPEEVENYNNYEFFNSVYAKDIFNYMKQREEKFILEKYMNRQTDINSHMRAILVDWLVDVQMNFEMSHETLYLAVKLVDHYLMEVKCNRSNLQLVGSTAFLIAAKFEEPYPPCLDDFLYICDDTYQRKEMIAMEISILQNLKFDINIPIAYHFLRRYAVCLCANMNTLTLSRFICELTLQEYDCVHEKASRLAAGCFLLALYMKKLGHWAPTLEHHSGYKTSDLHPLVIHLNKMLNLRACSKLKTVHSKYSHKVFFEVAKIPPVSTLELEQIVNACKF